MYLQNYSWCISYFSNENNPIADFYIPAEEMCGKLRSLRQDFLVVP